MSIGTEPADSAPAVPERRVNPAFSSPHLRTFLIAFATAVSLGMVAYFWLLHRESDLIGKQQEQIEKAFSELRTTERLTSAEVAALRTSGAKGVEELRSEISRMRASWETAQRELEVLRRQASERQSALAVSRAKLTRVLTQARKTQEQLKTLQAELATWKKDYEPLLTNETGRRIAASESHLQLVTAPLQRLRPTVAELVAWGQMLNQLIEPLDTAQREMNDDAVLTNEHVAEIDRIDKSVHEAHERVRTDRAVLDAALAETASVQPGAATIQESFQARTVAQAKALQERLESARKTALAEQAASMEKAQAEVIAAETAVKLQQQANEKARSQSQLSDLSNEQKAIIQRQQEELVRQQLEREFQAVRAEVDSLLVAFTQDGLQSRGGNPGKGPMSFSLIQSAGALSRDETGRQNLAHLVGNGGRNTGPLPRFRGGMTKPQQDACDRAQQLLTRFGPLMVEKGMLAK